MEYGEGALQDLGLLEGVVKFKQQFYYSKQAEYDLAKPGTFHLVPNKAAIKLLNDDYQSMTEMFFGDYPEFDHILEEIEAFQNKLNNL